MSLKFRIIAWFSLMILLLSALIVTIVFVVSAEALADDPEEELVKMVSQNASRLTSDKKHKNEEFITYRDGVYCQLIDKNGNHIKGAMPTGIDNTIPLENGKISTIITNEDEYYVYNMQVIGSFWIRGAVSTSQPSQTTTFILLSASIITPCIIFISIFVGFIITKYSLKPIDKVILSMEAINSGDDLSKRITMPKGPIEIRRLSNEFDRMTIRLDKSFESEKQFASDVSHELKTPLTVALAECERAKEIANDNDTQKSLEVIEKQCNRMSQLVGSLLSITSLEQGTQRFPLSQINLSDFLEVYCEAFASENNISDSEEENKKSLTLDIEKDLTVRLNPSLMSRVICNLLDNARKYTGKNGKIKVSLNSTDKEIVLRVSDNGIGISEDNLPKIWRRFWQADASREIDKGLGLGLSMVKEMVELQGGKITAESKLNEGTSFIITFKK